MTTCAYDGQILATDSRSTGSAGTNKSYKCAHCGEHSHRVNDEAVKIYGDFDGKKYRDEVIHALAGAGSVTDIKKVVNLIQRGENLDEVYRILGVLDESRNAFSATFIIVTEKSVFVLKNNDETRKIGVKRHERSEKVAIGTGRAAALFAMKALEMSAPEAVAAACIGDEHSGGNIRWVDCNKPAGKPDSHNIISCDVAVDQAAAIQETLAKRFAKLVQAPTVPSKRRMHRNQNATTQKK